MSGVYVQTLRTGTRERVSARAGVNSSPTFSPDGRMLALTLSRDTGNLDIHTLDLSTQVLRQLTTDAAIDTEATLVARRPQHLLHVGSRRRPAGLSRRHGARRTRAARDVRGHLQRAAAGVARRQADRRRVRARTTRYRIGVVDPANGELQMLTNGRLDESPSFAPNGAQIIYATRENGRGVLASVSTDGRIKTQIASVAGDVREPVWGPFPRP